MFYINYSHHFSQNSKTLQLHSIKATTNQSFEEGLEQYLQCLKNHKSRLRLSSDNSRSGKGQIYQRRLFNGLKSNYICQRLLENKQLDLATAHEQAGKQSCSYLKTSVAEVILNTHTPTSSPIQVTQTGKKRQSSKTDFLISATTYTCSKSSFSGRHCIHC